ncbi:SCO6745 family protein [Lentzea sp. E54]|uniref:SCO6745 family protein n=1 Tax=Lentzea xerophila TaxID=3435883 RepID=UPI003DA417F2
MDAQECARTTREVLVHRGGRFMVAPELATQERLLQVPARSLYFRGRSAVLGDPPPAVVAELFGIFPAWLVEIALTSNELSAGRAVEAYTAGCWEWGRHHLAAVAEPDRVADLLFTVVDEADGSGLALFAGWRRAPRPDDAPGRLAHALMVARELRGGLHFAALRSCGLGVVDAVFTDPDSGPDRLRQTGWREQDVEPVRARLRDRTDLPERWRRAQQITDQTFGACLGVLPSPKRAQLATALRAAA